MKLCLARCFPDGGQFEGSSAEGECYQCGSRGLCVEPKKGGNTTFTCSTRIGLPDWDDKSHVYISTPYTVQEMALFKELIGRLCGTSRGGPSAANALESTRREP
jgi:hypothetical protein